MPQTYNQKEQTLRRQSQNLYGCARYNTMEQHVKHHLTSTIMALGGLSLAFLSTAGLIHKSMQSTLVPYLVTVDSHGVVLNSGKLSPSVTIPQSIITAQICDFIHNLRMVTEDKELQQRAILKTYAFVAKGSKTASELTDFYQKNNPLRQNQRSSVAVSIVNAITVNDHTLQIDWKEQQVQDVHTTVQKYRALVTFFVQSPEQADAETLLLNPLGIIIDSFTLSEILN